MALMHDAGMLVNIPANSFDVAGTCPFNDH